MDQHTNTRLRADRTPRLHEERNGPPRAGWRPVFGLVLFGLLLAATLAIEGLAGVPPMPGIALVAAGMMLLLGVADLLDPAARRVIIGVRIGGMAMALLGLAVQVLG